jgi:hypothetical protein
MAIMGKEIKTREDKILKGIETIMFMTDKILLFENLELKLFVSINNKTYPNI